MATTVPIKQYDDLDKAKRDQQTLEEVGLHPEVHRGQHDDLLLSDADVESGGTLVLTVPEPEAAKAMEVLEASREAEVADVEDYGE